VQRTTFGTLVRDKPSFHRRITLIHAALKGFLHRAAVVRQEQIPAAPA